MAQPSPSNYQYQNPLCVTKETQIIYNLGKQQGDKNPWRGRIEGGNIYDRGMLETFIPTALFADSLVEALDKNYFTVVDGETSISLKDRIEDTRHAQERTFKQIFSGESPEFNSHIEQLVEKKIQELLPLRQERQQEEQNELEVGQEIKKLAQQATRVYSTIPHQNERNTRIQSILEQIQKTLSIQQSKSAKDEALEQIMALFQDFLKHQNQ